MTIELRSPAKVNLFLKVLNKRSDGYHNLASLFQTVDLCDRLCFQLDDEDALYCSDPLIPLDRRNLIWKAIDAFRLKTGTRLCFKIHLDKQIPSEAGLGGGSSNAATALWAVNNLSGNLLSIEQLQCLSRDIGSDVPFFFSRGLAYCSGRGEDVENLDPVDLPSMVCYKPAFGLSTSDVYRAFMSDSCASTDFKRLLQDFIEGRPCFFNDLESAAFILEPRLAAYKQVLQKRGFHDVILAGSGSSLVAFNAASSDLELEDCRSFDLTAIQRQPNQWW